MSVVSYNNAGKTTKLSFPKQLQKDKPSMSLSPFYRLTRASSNWVWSKSAHCGFRAFTTCIRGKKETAILPQFSAIPRNFQNNVVWPKKLVWSLEIAPNCGHIQSIQSACGEGCAIWICIRILEQLRVSRNWDTPKWMVYNEKCN